MIIHQCDHLAVDLEPANSEIAVVIFASAADGQLFRPQASARKAGIAAIRIRALAATWSDEADFAPAIAAIRAVTARFGAVTAYGEGLGALPALRHARSVGADTALAIFPRWEEGARIEHDDTVANAYVIHDLHSAAGGLNIRQFDPAIHAIPMPFGERLLGEPAVGTPTFVALLEACRTGDPTRVRGIARDLRRRAPHRASGLAAALLPRHPGIALAIMARHRDRFTERQAEEVVTAAAKGALQRPSTRAGQLRGFPTVTIFGSCRVYNPCARLAADGRVRLNQSNIFGFVHCAPEVLQQLRLISGETIPPSRLRPYLNIGDHWRSPAPGGGDELEARFAATDVFVVEVSSVRLLRFKAFLLQINRTRELLASDPMLTRDWWTPLLRTGANAFATLPDMGWSATQSEIMAGLTLVEQPVDSIRRDVEAIARRLGKPVVFVPHFNTDMTGQPIAQRAAILTALAETRTAVPSAVFDPTPAVLAAGVGRALADAAHYQPAFEPHLADLIAAQIGALLPR